MLAVGAVAGVDAQSGATANVEVRVWQRISDAESLYVSARPEDGSWRTLGTIPIAMTGLSDSRAYRYGDITVTLPRAGASEAVVEVRVWQRISDARSLYISARPRDGSWRTLGTIPLDLSGLSDSGSYRYGDITVRVPVTGASAPPPPPSADACVFAERIGQVRDATFQVRNDDGSGGTAFYIGDGEWITNHHVVEEVASTSLVHGDTRIGASVAGSLPDYDLALLSARPGAALVPLEFAPERPQLASPVTAVGFPTGVVGTPSVTRGIVSKHAPFSQFRGFAPDGVMIQIDAEINPGNSGGPIVDDCGAVVGVAVLKAAASPDGRDVDGIGFGIAAETVAAQLANLRAAGHRAGTTPRPGGAPRADSYLTITAFCTYRSHEEVGREECDRRSPNLAAEHDRWHLWAEGVVDYDDVFYRFNGGRRFFQAGMGRALATLGAGCHELQIAEEGLSTHWSAPYGFCFVSATPSPTSSTLPAPTGLSASTVDIAFAPDDVHLVWNHVAGAAWYEVWHAPAGGQWALKGRPAIPAYRDLSPSWLFADSYRVRACNDAGCSASSAAVTHY